MDWITRAYKIVVPDLEELPTGEVSASVGQRINARLTDILIWALAILIYGIVWRYLVGTEANVYFDILILTSLIFAIEIIQIHYWGDSFGKKLSKLKTVDKKTGGAASRGQLIYRAIYLIVAATPISIIILAPAFFRRPGLHERWSKTRVIKIATPKRKPLYTLRIPAAPKWFTNLFKNRKSNQKD